MKKCKDCKADCENICMETWDYLENIDNKGAFLFWPAVALALIAIISLLAS